MLKKLIPYYFVSALCLCFFSAEAGKGGLNFEANGPVYESYPRDAAVVDDNFRWLVSAGAQRLVSATNLKIEALDLLFQSKRKLSVSIKVVDSQTGEEIFTKGPFKAEGDEEASSWEVETITVELDEILLPGSYFVYPVVHTGKLAYLPEYTRSNKIAKTFRLYKGMYQSPNKGSDWTYDFSEKDEEDPKKLTHYGPALNWKILHEKVSAIGPDSAKIEALMDLVGRNIKEENAATKEFSDEFKQMDEHVGTGKNKGEALSTRGTAHSNIGNYSAAIRDFTVALWMDSSDNVARVNRGVTYAKMGEYELALKDLDSASAIDVTDPLIYYIKGFVERKLGKLDDALLDFSKAIAFNPRDPLSYYMRGRTKFQQKDFEGALLDYEQALVIDPNYWAVFKHRGILHQEMGNVDVALDDFRRAVELNLKDSTVNLRRAKIFEKRGQLEEALSDYQAVLKVDSMNLGVLQKAGELATSLKYNDMAIGYFDQILEQNPQYYKAYLHRGIAKVQKGEIGNACIDFTTAQHEPSKQLKKLIKQHCKKFDTSLKK